MTTFVEYLSFLYSTIPISMRYSRDGLVTSESKINRGLARDIPRKINQS